jgi:hypothetical protein
MFAAFVGLYALGPSGMSAPRHGQRPSPAGAGAALLTAGRHLGETGPLSQGVQEGRQALSLYSTHTVWRCIGRGPGVQVNPLNPVSVSPWLGTLERSQPPSVPAGGARRPPNERGRGRRRRLALARTFYRTCCGLELRRSRVRYICMCLYALIYARCAVRCDGQDDIDRASSEHTLRRRVHVRHITHAA